MTQDRGLPDPGLVAPRDPNAPLFRLTVDEGAGAPLAAASGDVAGGLAGVSYSWISQVSTVVAYHVLRHGSISPPALVEELLELHGRNGGPSTYRGAPAAFVSFLESARMGNPTPGVEPSPDPAGRVAPIGVWYRKDPEGLLSATIEAVRITHRDAATAVAACAVSGAVAGSSFAMNGRDLLLGASETASAALTVLGKPGVDAPGLAEARALPARIKALAAHVDLAPRELVERFDGDNGPSGLDRVLCGLALGASRSGDPVRMIEVAAMSGGSLMGSITGAIVGARAGLMRWPWRVPNENWFAEIGRRLRLHNREIRDLPVPAAVEEGMAGPGGPPL